MGTITFNNITSSSLGVEVETFPDYVAPEKEYQVTHIPGRNGDLVVDTKTFQNVPRSYEVSVATNGVPIEVVNAAVARFKSGSRMPIKSLSSEIVAVQDLHGYDHPWPAGGGKNLLNNSDKTTTQASYVIDNINVPMVAGNYVLSFNFSGTGNSSSLRVDDENGTPIFTITKTVSVGRNEYLIRLPSNGSFVKLYSNAVGTYTNFQIESGSTATDFAPYENICPITGFDSGVVTRCGKNLFDNSLMVNSKTTVVGDTVTLTATGNFQGSAFAFMPVKQGYKYALSFDSLTSGSAVEIRRYNATGTVTNTIVITQNTIINIIDGTTVKISIVYGNRTAGAGTFVLKGFNIASGEDYQSYEPYNGNTFTVNFGSTIFGGYFDNKGNQTINANGFKLVNNNKIALQGSSNNNNVWRILSATSNVLNNNKQLCNIATYDSNAWSPNDGRANTFVIGGEGNLYLQLPKSVANTLADFITYITNNNIYFYYELVSPRATADGEGNLVITHSIVDLSTINFVYYQSGANFAYVLMPAYKSASVLLCSQYPQIPRSKIGYSEPYDNTVKGVGMDGKYLFIKDVDRVTTAGQQALLSGVQLVYELATPIVLPITSQNIFTLPGENTIFSNSGDVSVKVEPSFSTIINQVAEWLHSASGYARLEDTYEPDYYRMAYYSESISVENLFNEAGKATLNFICKPQRYLKSGETPVTFTGEGTIQNGTRFSSSPVLKVTTDNTQGSVAIGNHSITIKAGAGTDPITIDCELQDAWSGTSNKNSYIVLTDSEFPVIDPGTQTVTFDGGVQSVEVIPRWWTV